MLFRQSRSLNDWPMSSAAFVELEEEAPKCIERRARRSKSDRLVTCCRSSVSK